MGLTGMGEYRAGSLPNDLDVDMAAHTFNPTTPEAETGEYL